MNQNFIPTRPGRPLIYGEVLFDVFPDQSVLGGAPFNVAWHLKGFGLDPIMVSRIGDDSLGKTILKEMNDWKMDTSAIQIHPKLPTGQVKIEMSGSEHRFEILKDQAYDAIEFDNQILGNEISLIYHGSLINRSSISTDTLSNYIQFSQKPVFIDINLRSPFWDKKQLQQILKRVRWAKLNHEELELLKTTETSKLIDMAKDFKEYYNLEFLVITKGEEGAIFLTNEIVEAKPIRVNNIADTVGAGDAFSSVVLLGIHRSWQISDILKRALEFSAHICAIRGAVSKEKELYDQFLKKWS